MIRVTIYWIGFAIVLVLLGVYLIFENEYERSEENSKYEQVIGLLCKIFGAIFFIFLAAFYGYNIYLLAIRYDTLMWLSLCFIVFFPSLAIFVVLFNQGWKYFNIIRSLFSVIFGVVAVLSALVYIIFFAGVLLTGFSYYPMNEDAKYTQYGYSIDILEMREVPYTNVSGSRWYIRSTPSNAYYYEVSTNNGNTTTKVLDGYSHYVEKDEDDKYIDNPHIEVIYTMQEYYNMYTMKTYTKVVGENYIICVPENAIYYEEE